MSFAVADHCDNTVADHCDHTVADHCDHTVADHCDPKDEAAGTLLESKRNGGVAPPPPFLFLGRGGSVKKKMRGLKEGIDTLTSTTKTKVRSIVLLIANISFVIVGSLIFQYIENTNAIDQEYHKYVYFIELKDFMRTYVLDNSSDPSYTYTELDDIRWEKLKELHGKRCYKMDNKETLANLWNFWSSLDYCSTVLTTIGYGNMAPKTDTGKFFTLFYSFFGIPLMAMYLAIFSKGIYRFTAYCIKHFVVFLNKRILIRVLRNKRRKAVTNVQFKTASLLFLTVILSIFVFVLSYLLHYTNNHDSLVACSYFYVMTLTTVGIGDISMTEANFVVLVRVLLVFCVGLTLVTAVFSAIRNLMLANKRNLKRATSKLRTATFFISSYQKIRKVSGEWRRRISGGTGSGTASSSYKRQTIGQTVDQMMKRNNEAKNKMACIPENDHPSGGLSGDSSCGSTCHKRLGTSVAEYAHAWACSNCDHVENAPCSVVESDSSSYNLDDG